MTMIGAVMVLTGAAIGVPVLIGMVVSDISSGRVPYRMKLWMGWCATVIAAGASIMWIGGGR